MASYDEDILDFAGCSNENTVEYLVTTMTGMDSNTCMLRLCILLFQKSFPIKLAI